MVPPIHRKKIPSSRQASSTSPRVNGSRWRGKGCVSISATARSKIWSGSSLSSPSSCVSGSGESGWLAGSVEASVPALVSCSVECIAVSLLEGAAWLPLLLFLVCRLGWGQGRAIVDENDGVWGAVADRYQNIGAPAAGRIPKAQTGWRALIV